MLNLLGKKKRNPWPQGLLLSTEDKVVSTFHLMLLITSLQPILID